MSQSSLFGEQEISFNSAFYREKLQELQKNKPGKDHARMAIMVVECEEIMVIMVEEGAKAKINTSLSQNY